MNGTTSPRLLRAARVVTGEQVLSPGWLLVEGEQVSAAGEGEPAVAAQAAAGVVDLGEAVLAPGLVDIHGHGGGGHSLATEDPAEAARAVDFHRARGTTTSVASLLSAAPEVLRRQLAALAELADEGTIAGIHLEGPWISSRRCGAHDPAVLREPDPAEVAALLQAARGHLRMVTLAPELPGATEAVRQLTGAGVTVAVGHTDADFATTRTAIEAGARVATHLFNGMPGLHHRAPGPVLALLQDPGVTVELIADGVHVHPAMVRHVLALTGPGRLALVTDAMAAAGMPDGDYTLGELPVEVRAGQARLRNGSLAGSTVTSDALYAAALAAAEGEEPDRLLAATLVTATTPARTLGLPAGTLQPGAPADLVVLQDQQVTSVMHRGRWVQAAPAGG
ncbi:N-acetylglucosamine-6-phosphate deacetylase [Ornithinicoccus halotolerans]|uniref:N-acetylglucosamine-6-phosphate deacetylase n=1 Tax=Ornithinicoccus halotolerans TaxID=1748220 RepID=UPI001E2DACA3|nr:N-acetylglucosamine-6-phosphate deacetylase [Ornithinicoccus halotolerans]